MLSLGAAAYYDLKEVGSFEVSFEELAGSSGDPDTLAWWASQPKETWEACRRDPQPVKLGMQQFGDWVNDLAARHGADPVCVAYPSGFDFLFAYWYFVSGGISSPFGFSCLDIQSYAAGLLRIPFKKSKKKHYPKEWLEGLPELNHKAVDDARAQGLMFLNMLKHNA